jgi:perosamine synthetase
MNDFATDLLELFKDTPRPVALHEPAFIGNELKYVQDCIESGWVSSVGSYVDRFAEDLGKYVNAHAVPTVNGTSALHLALIIAGVQPGDEVLVPNLTFIATANAVHYCHATPHFIEAEAETYGADPDALKSYLRTTTKTESNRLINKQTGRPISALIVTHIFGQVARITELKAIADEYNLILIEDAAESLGSFYKSQHTGTFGHIAALSFNGNKTITTGGGGAVITTNPDLAQKAKHLSTTAKVPHPHMHSHDQIGYNYRMPNINAALGCAQLETLQESLKQKRKLAQIYREFCTKHENIKFLDEPPNTKSNFWLNTVKFKTESERNTIIERLESEQIFARGVWMPMTDLNMYKNNPSMPTPVAKDLAYTTLNLPSSPQLLQHIGS